MKNAVFRDVASLFIVNCSYELQVSNNCSALGRDNMRCLQDPE
jgi:hypothetical protein